jgi:hypothetical protein
MRDKNYLIALILRSFGNNANVFFELRSTYDLLVNAPMPQVIAPAFPFQHLVKQLRFRRSSIADAFRRKTYGFILLLRVLLRGVPAV